MQCSSASALGKRVEFFAGSFDLPRMNNEILFCSVGEIDIMANVSKLIVAISAISIVSPFLTNPVLAAKKDKAISSHQNEYVPRSRPVSGVYNVVPASSISDPASRPYHYDPGSAPNGP